MKEKETGVHCKQGSASGSRAPWGTQLQTQTGEGLLAGRAECQGVARARAGRLRARAQLNA